MSVRRTVLCGAAVLAALSVPRATFAEDVRAELLYTITDETDDYLMWSPTDIMLDLHGTLYVLDGRLRCIFVFREGGFTRRFGRRGEGPGELQNPTGLFRWGGDIGVLDFAPATVHRFTREGVHITSRRIEDPSGRRVRPAEIRSAGHDLVLRGSINGPGPGGKQTSTSFLALLGADGHVGARFAEMESTFDLNHLVIDEARVLAYTLWACERGPTVLLSEDPSRSVVRRLRPGGVDVNATGMRESDDILGIRGVPVPRSESRMEQRREELAPGPLAESMGIRYEVHVLDHEPALTALRVDRGGSVWMLAGSDVERFEQDGRSYVRQTWIRADSPTPRRTIIVPADLERDRVEWLDEDRIVVVRNARQSDALDPDAESEGSADDTPSSLSVYYVPPRTGVVDEGLASAVH